VSGLTPGNSYTWDAAYGIETLVASTNIRYGGPNDTTGNNAYGAFGFEVWEAGNCLGAVLYDPASAATKSLTALLAMTALDTTNARITFTAPASGKVRWRIAANSHANTAWGELLLGILDGATVKARSSAMQYRDGTSAATTFTVMEASGLITGLTPGNSYTYDAAYGVETAFTGGSLKWGGPDNTTANDAFGALVYEIWAA
jgi:hypothetical protein